MNKFFLTNQSNSFRKWSLVFSLALAILSLYFIPENNMDLSVYYHIIDNIGVFTGLEKFSYVFSRGEYITMIYFWIMSLFKNRHLVQFIPVFLIYFLSLFTDNPSPFHRQSVPLSPTIRPLSPTIRPF